MNLGRIARGTEVVQINGKPVEVTVELLVDWRHLLRHLAPVAIQNKSGRSVLGGGAVVVTARIPEKAV
jgi:hypothetical protein